MQERSQIVIVFHDENRETIVGIVLFRITVRVVGRTVDSYIVVHQELDPFVVFEMRFSYRKRDLERTAYPLLALHIDTGMVQIDQLFHQRQTYSGRLLIDIILQNRIESLEKHGNFRRLYAHALILHGDNHILVVALYPHGNRFSGWRILEGIGYDIDKYFFEFIPVGPHVNIIGSHFEAEIDSVLTSYILEILHNGFQRFPHIEFLDKKPHLFVLYLTEIENLIDEIQHTMGIGLHHRKILPVGLGQLLVGQHLGKRPFYQCKGRAQFMRNIGEEAELRLGEAVFEAQFIAQLIDMQINKYHNRHQNKRQ